MNSRNVRFHYKNAIITGKNKTYRLNAMSPFLVSNEK